MLYKSLTSNAASLSGLGTSAHETGTSTLCLTGNPYTDFARLGMDLHACRICYRRTPNAQGATVTGTFNISGTGYTRHVRAEKRLRNTLSFISRHPDATVLPAYLS